MNKDKKTKKLPKWTKIVLCIFSAIILTIAALCTYSYYTVNNIVNKSEKIDLKEDVYEVLLRPVRLSKPVQHQKLSCSLSVLPGSCGMLLLHMLRLRKK